MQRVRVRVKVKVKVKVRPEQNSHAEQSQEDPGWSSPCAREQPRRDPPGELVFIQRRSDREPAEEKKNHLGEEG